MPSFKFLMFNFLLMLMKMTHKHTLHTIYPSRTHPSKSTHAFFSSSLPCIRMVSVLCPGDWTLNGFAEIIETRRGPPRGQDRMRSTGRRQQERKAFREKNSLTWEFSSLLMSRNVLVGTMWWEDDNHFTGAAALIGWRMLLWDDHRWVFTWSLSCRNSPICGLSQFPIAGSQVMNQGLLVV